MKRRQKKNPAELVLMGANPHGRQRMANRRMDSYDKKHLSAWIRSQGYRGHEAAEVRKKILQTVKQFPEVLDSPGSRSWPEILRISGNPAELVLMGANPLQMVNSHFSEDEKLALGRLGISWKGIQTAADVRKARRALKDAAAIRRRFKNPHQNPLPMAEQRERAAEIYSGFHATPPENKIVLDEPHIPAGAYPELGLLMLVTFKPNKKARDGYEKNYVNEKENVHVIGSLDRDQIYFAGGDQAMSENDLRFFGWSGEDLFHLGAATKIVYLARKYHEQIEENARGELVEWIHELGEETGEKPQFWYDVRLKRIFFRQGAYEIRDEGIVN